MVTVLGGNHLCGKVTGENLEYAKEIALYGVLNNEASIDNTLGISIYQRLI